jgi:hypothetical protein
MPRQYSFLQFRPGVDWQHVNPVLLARLNRLGSRLRKVITIVSGARTPENNMGVSGSHHIPGNNPSGIGEAVDAYIGKKALANAVSESTLKKYGLYSGNRPGFYKGQPDPEHIETLERRGFKYKGPSAMPPVEEKSAPEAQAQPTSPSAIDISQSEPNIAAGPPDPGSTIASPIPPGTLQAEVSTPNKLADTWQLLAADPISSPETQAFARRLGSMNAQNPSGV